MRVFNRLLAQLIIFSCVIASAEVNVPMSKPNCEEKCANITIPYPFGIGPNCYLSPYFEITCNGSSPRPFLRKLNLEVLDISVDTLLVNGPVYSTCKYGSSWNSSDLRGTPFSIYNTNRFLTFGCGNTLMMDRSSNVLAGCTSTCGNASSSSKSCYGINCCQTTIPDYADFYRLASTVNASACTYAFLADDDWFRTNFSSNLSIIMRQEYIPVTLSWGILRKDFPRANESDSGRTCNHPSWEYLQCWCRSYYRGNPYILNGCQIEPECAHCKESCSQNEALSFFCMPNIETKMKEVIIAGTLGGAAGIVILIIFSIWIHKIIKRKKELKLRQKFFKRNGGSLLQQQLSATKDSFDTTKIFTVRELEKATDNFNISRVLGQGGQGTVYKGMLIDGKIVAVKKSKLVDEGQVEQFINEVVILSQINHRNIVKLLGCCLETDVPLLVYEFISNGTLSQLIRNQDDDFPFSWEMRLQIATEVSGALAYLHSATSVPIYHRDIKSSNILLDDKFRAKVADFGTSRSVAIDQTHLTTIVQGTFGYLDPEFFQSSQFTDKSDVYSFGVVLAELLTSEAPIMTRTGQSGRSLATYFISALEDDFLFEIIDGRVAEEGSRDEVVALAVLARRCMSLNGRQRPTMKEVMFGIERIRAARVPSFGVSNRFHHVQSIGGSNKKQEYDLSSSSLSDYPPSVSDDSFPLMYTGE